MVRSVQGVMKLNLDELYEITLGFVVKMRKFLEAHSFLCVTQMISFSISVVQSGWFSSK